MSMGIQPERSVVRDLVSGSDSIERRPDAQDAHPAGASNHARNAGIETFYARSS